MLLILPNATLNCRKYDKCMNFQPNVIQNWVYLGISYLSAWTSAIVGYELYLYQ